MSLISKLPTRRGDASPTMVLVIVCAGVVLASLDLFIVNVALPDIARDLHTSNLADLSWVLNAYAIVYASLLVLFGRLAESRRRENGFLLGVVIFTAASAACGAASNLTTLIIFRILQAAGAALLTPTSLSLVLATTAPEKRHGAVRAWTAVGGLAAALGPVVGGLLVAASWRWVFFVNVPIGLAAAVIGWQRLPRVEGHPVRSPDALGALLVTAGVALLTLGLVKGNDWGWGATTTIVTLARGGRRDRPVRAALRAQFQPVDRRGPVQGPRVHRLVDGGADLLDLVRRDALFARALDAGRVALVGAADRPGDRARPADGAAVRVRVRRPTDQALRPRAGDRRRRNDLRGRPDVVCRRRRPAAALRHRDARRHDPHRHRRRPDPADVHGDRRRIAAPELVRDRLGRGQHAAPGGPRGRRRAVHRRARHPRGGPGDRARLSPWHGGAGGDLAAGGS